MFRRVTLGITILLILSSFLLAETHSRDQIIIEAKNATESTKIVQRILFSYFNTWPKMATFSWYCTIEGVTEQTVGTITQKTTLKTELEENYWVKKTDDPKWIFEISHVIIGGTITVNGIKTPIP